jgi:hypothetical protein
MRRSRVQVLVAAPSAGHAVSDDYVSACIYRDNAPCVVDMGRGGGQNRASLLGGVPERSKGSDCKSDGTAFEGSNPSPSTRQFESSSERDLLESQPTDAVDVGRSVIGIERIVRRVWFNGRTSAFQAEGAGSIPATRSIERMPSRAFGRLANGGPNSRKLYCSHSSVGRALPW